MLLAQLGAAFLLAALVLAVASAVLAFVAGRRCDFLLAAVARRAFYAASLAVGGASGALLAGLLGHDFALAFVAEHTDRAMPWALTAASFYGGQEGSLLLWTLLLGLVGSVALAAAPDLGGRLSAYSNGVLASVACFFLVVLVFVASPFDLLELTPRDGFGLNPLLRDGGMLVHPPFLLAGYASFAVPFSAAMASLMAGRHDAGWDEHVRRFALVAWALQGAGLTLGMWWAYHVLGWGGYWGWDPVEDVALMPWLLTTAYLHTALVQRRQPGQMRGWAQGLVIGAFLLSVFGTFIVRSGVLPSVHSFAVSPLGPWFLGFFLLCLAASGAVLAWRSGEPGSQPPLELTFSREGAFVLQNVLLVALTGAVLWGVMLPLLSGMLGRQLVVGPAYYERTAGPLLLLLLALLAVGPFLPWRSAGLVCWQSLRWPLAAALFCLSALVVAGVRQPAALASLPLIAAGLVAWLSQYVGGARAGRRLAGPWPLAASKLVVRNRRRYGAFLAHLGLLVAAAGIAVSHFGQRELDVTLRPGQAVTVAGHTLTYQGSFQEQQGDHVAEVARLGLGQEMLEPSRLTYPDLGGQAVSRVAIRSTPLEDVYVVLAGTSGDEAAFRIFVNPLVTWIWAGAALLVGGVLLGNLGRTERVSALSPAAGVAVVAR